MKIIKALVFALLFVSVCSAQEDIVQLKNVSDTILNTKRTLIVSGQLDAVKTMQQLFPGKLYNLSDHNSFVSWKCKSCKTASYTDVNGEEGLQTGRFSGGLIGVAKFAKNDKIWEMRSFQPAVAAFGAFAQAPKPKLVEIGEDQYAFTLLHVNGGGGGPFEGILYLVAGFDGKYQPIMEVYDYQLINVESTEWSSSYTVVNDNNKKHFRDIIIKTKGSFNKAAQAKDEFEVNLPAEIATMAKTNCPKPIKNQRTTSVQMPLPWH